jgi:hypothetical protein
MVLPLLPLDGSATDTGYWIVLPLGLDGSLRKAGNTPKFGGFNAEPGWFYTAKDPPNLCISEWFPTKAKWFSQ